jgi:hypothetical protein
VAVSRVGERRLSLVNRSRALSAFGAIVAGVLTAGAIAAAAAQPGVGHNLRAAGADAAVLMNSLHLPPSATRSAGAPFGDGGLLGRSPESAIAGSPQVVDESAFWTSPRSERAILAFVQADPPAGIVTLFNGAGSVAGNSFRFVGYGWPAIPNVLQLRWLTVEVTALTGGGPRYAPTRSSRGSGRGRCRSGSRPERRD